MTKRKRSKEQTTIYKTLHRKPSNMNPTKIRGCMQVLRMGRQFLLHYWHPSCYKSYDR